ncbi:hypothetical protein [Shewanella putrefaciens]|uniref:hypothetical protein n=1 Tax=Shewanella putrefaciens TaxID=24 RepID=UPI0002F70286|nr:hypothetical protein [Shewanella putrefaciens]AVV83899.1 hypothetical protein SPWS13_2110 [Shewanella putrefaciens]
MNLERCGYLLMRNCVYHLDDLAELWVFCSPVNLYLYIARAFYLGFASGTMAAVF